MKQKLNEAIEDGLEDAELEATLTAEYRRLLEERNKRIEQDEQDQKSGKAKTPAQQTSASMSVSLDRSSIDQSADENSQKTEKVMKFGEWKRQQREEQRKIRDRNNSIRTNQPQMMKYLKGEMDKQERENWKNYIA